MNRSILLLFVFTLTGISLLASNNPVVKKTRTGATIEVQVITEGNINLFFHESQVLPATLPEDPLKPYTEAFITYYVSKGADDLTEIHCANYKDVLKAQLIDKPEIAEKIGQKGYKFKDLDNIILLYNK